ncbi:glycine cleavage system protein GcvH [Mobilitalea sibirica]|uniref:Glycine cleavage system H protein n=1 Tax=Mobilitalea sibirica TaxID=1462919 RepID=A0A8J7HCP2_9FIRM|nr:glycine cleavage system protein GcvH [Mobilitalea sibirica]MBH1940099.1 glycine cleavage system protein GcvH [Mobilitalea sibirica]
MSNQGMLYAKSHEWVQFLDETTVRVGISDYAQSELGDLVFINLPEVGDEVVAGEPFADVESVKAVSNVYSPVTGIIKAINEELLDQPELVNSDPFEAWFMEVEEISDRVELISETEYDEMIHNN